MSTKYTRREMLKMSSLFGASAVLAACAPAAQNAASDAASDDAMPAGPEAAEVVIMYQANELSDAEVEQFNDDYSPISLTRIDSDYTRFYAMYASGEAPDLLRVQAPAIPQMRARDILLNMQPFFDTSDVINEEDMTGVNDYYRVADAMHVGDGDLYGMVKDWAPDTFLWVNETVFEKAGVDVPDFSSSVDASTIADLAGALTTKNGDQFETTGYDTVGGFIDRIWMTMVKASGSSIFSEDFTQTNIANNDAAVEAIRFFHDMAAEGAMSSPVNPSPAWFGPDFAAGRLALLSTGYWFHGFAVADPTEEFQAAIADGKIKMYPNFTWGGEHHNRCITAAGAVASNQTKSPEATWTAFEWFMGKEPAENRARSGWGLPATNEMFELTPKDGPLSSQAWESIQADLPNANDVLSFNPFLAGGEPMVPGQVYLSNWEQVFNGDLSLDDLITQMEDETNLAIQEGRDRIGA